MIHTISFPFSTFADGGEKAKNRIWDMAAFPLNSSLEFNGTDEEILKKKIQVGEFLAEHFIVQ